MSLPEERSASRVVYFDQPADSLWRILTDYGGYATWRPEVSRVEMLPERNGHSVWREYDKRGRRATYEAEETVPRSRLEVMLIDEGRGISGSLTMEIEPDGGGCFLSIKEKSYIRSPFFRFIASLFQRRASTIDARLRALGARLGQKLIL